MNDGLAGLVGVLKEKYGKLLELKTILEEEQEHISRFRAAELDEMTLRKEKVIGELKVTRGKVASILSGCCPAYGLPARSGLAALIGRLPEPEKGELSCLNCDLAELSRKIGELLDINRERLESGLSVINRSIGYFRRVFSKSDTYGSSGRMMEAPSARLFCKEI